MILFLNLQTPPEQSAEISPNPNRPTCGEHLSAAQFYHVTSSSIEPVGYGDPLIGEIIPNWVVPAGKLRWQWKVSFCSTKYIFIESIFHCYVSLLEGIILSIQHS